ncbi:hypothetical protein, partial [Escherichia coli]
WRVGQAVGASVCSLLVSALVKELSGAIGDLGNHDRQRLDSSLVYIGAHNVIRVMLKRPLRKYFPQRPL